MLEYNGGPILMNGSMNGSVNGTLDDSGFVEHKNEAGMVDYSPYSPPTISKSSPVSLGLMIMICIGVMWQATTIATMKADLRSLPGIEEDIDKMKQMMAVNTGGDIRRDFEIRSNTRRIDVLEDK